ncbi:MAG: hypothetical protein HY917_04035 [Candidatus Diapherotrites archaeon]|nr:hypothetical protein [Candidatus Diapherotrites archaeon]
MAEEKSIIEIIQKIVKEGAKEEEIVSTLTDLGVEPEQAKRLLLLGQANTFALLRGEIKTLVEEEIQKKQPEIKKILDEQSKIAIEAMKKETKALAQKEQQEVEDEIKKKTASFQKDIDERVTKSAGLTERTKDKLNELGEAVSKVTLDLDELKVAGVGKRNQLVSQALMVAGVGFFALDAYLFLVEFQAQLSSESIISLILFAAIGMALLFVATIL